MRGTQVSGGTFRWDSRHWRNSFLTRRRMEDGNASFPTTSELETSSIIRKRRMVWGFLSRGRKWQQHSFSEGGPRELSKMRPNMRGAHNGQSSQHGERKKVQNCFHASFPAVSLRSGKKSSPAGEISRSPGQSNDRAWYPRRATRRRARMFA